MATNSIPVSWALHFSGASDTAIFCTSFAAIIPLAALLGFATEEMALRVGHVGAMRLLYATPFRDAD